MAPKKRKWSLNPVFEAYDEYKNRTDKPSGPPAKWAVPDEDKGKHGYGPNAVNPIDKENIRRHGKDYYTRGAGRIDAKNIPKEWKRWPNTYRALKSQGRWAGANDQEMNMILDMARRGWLDGSPVADHNRNDRVATRLGMVQALGMSQWSFPWDAWREDYKRYHQ